MITVTCSECRKPVTTRLLKHYSFYHPDIYHWAVKLNVTARQTRRFFAR